MRECLRFRHARKSRWDGLDELLYQRGFDLHWEVLPAEEKLTLLMENLDDLKSVQKMLPSVEKVPVSALFDLLLKTRSARYSWSDTDANGWLEVAGQLLAKGADPNHIAEDPLGIGPFSVLEKCFSGGNKNDPKRALEWAELVLAAGADPNLKGHPEHGPPLELALRWDEPAGMLLLLEWGIDPTAATLLDRRAPNIAQAFRAWERRQKLEGSPRLSRTSETPIPRSRF